MNLNHARLPIPPPGLMAKRYRLNDLKPCASDRPNATLSRQHRQPAGSKFWIFDGLIPPTATGGNELQAVGWLQTGKARTVRPGTTLGLPLEFQKSVDSVQLWCPRHDLSNNIVTKNWP
jgi:hypothetical protein